MFGVDLYDKFSLYDFLSPFKRVILQRFKMQDFKPIYTPLIVNFKLSSGMSPSN